MPSTWTRLRGLLDPLARRLGHYTAYPLGSGEHVGFEPDATVSSARERLRDAGYGPQWLSAAKKHPDTGQLHDLSYRKVPNVHPEPATGTRLGEFDPRRCQLHVHAFRVSGGVDYYSHYELRPDFRLLPGETLGDMLGRLGTHYRPEWGETYLLGVSSLE